ncbi:hypothetical protein [Nocardiopsis potens]|uniref:hypothetical protein n=1 Tax=Nocardiopsis potens TaxID=1246458 RepID=UPI00034BA369|nr:hypothetical protein [Nocardiopsis potens]
MAIQIKRRRGDFDAEAAMARLQELAREQADRFGPYADQARSRAEQARSLAEQRLLRARGWTAPRLETAALRVEDTVAPRVSDLLNTAAQRVEPNPARRGLMAARQGGRRIPRPVVYAGVAALGALALYGVIKLRKAAQDAEWQENLDQAREQVRETREKLAAKASRAGKKADEETAQADEAEEKKTAGVGTAPAESNGRAEK